MKKAQSLVEFAAVFLLTVTILLAIIEVSLFFRTSFKVEKICKEASEIAVKNITDINQQSKEEIFNSSAQQAFEYLEKNIKTIKNGEVNFEMRVVENNPPFNTYIYESTEKITTENGEKPLISFTIDYSSPYKNGVRTNLIYIYKPIILKARIKLPEGNTIYIIPENIEIKSNSERTFYLY